MAIQTPDGAQLVFNRPTYGGARRIGLSANSVANDTVVLATITGTGKIYGGFAKASDTGNGIDNGFRLTIDSVFIDNPQFSDLALHNVDTPALNSIYYVLIDGVGFNYIVGFMPNLTFEESFEVAFSNISARIFPLTGAIIYSLL